jgi:hypothetical protein
MFRKPGCKAGLFYMELRIGNQESGVLGISTWEKSCKVCFSVAGDFCFRDLEYSVCVTV